MSQLPISSQRTLLERLPSWTGWAITIIALTAGIAPFAPYIAAAARESGGLHAPNFALWLAAPFKVQLHSAAAMTALAIGTAIMLRPKGRALHRTLGWAWVIAMAVTAVSSLFITTLNNGVSFLHLLSGWTIIVLPMAVWAIRRGKVQVHRRAMTGMFVGGLIIAGALNFIPGRMFWTMFFG